MVVFVIRSLKTTSWGLFLILFFYILLCKIHLFKILEFFIVFDIKESMTFGPVKLYFWNLHPFLSFMVSLNYW